MLHRIYMLVYIYLHFVVKNLAPIFLLYASSPLSRAAIVNWLISIKKDLKMPRKHSSPGPPIEPVT